MYFRRCTANGTLLSDKVLALAEKIAVALLQVSGKVEALRVLAVRAANWDVDAWTGSLEGELFYGHVG